MGIGPDFPLSISVNISRSLELLSLIGVWKNTFKQTNSYKFIYIYTDWKISEFISRYAILCYVCVHKHFKLIYFWVIKFAGEY